MNKKGFTLIELLAVIVLLAIIMIIAIPKILNVIDSSRQSSWNSAVRLVKKAIETNSKIIDFETNEARTSPKLLCNNETNNEIEVTSNLSRYVKVGDMDIKCKKDENYIFRLIGKNQFVGKEAIISCTLDGICTVTNITYNGSVINNSSLYSAINANVSDAIYFDPVTTNECNSDNYNISSIVNNTSTCYRWRVLSKSSDTFTVQMDHDLIYTGWGANVSNGPTTVLSNLAQATITWTRVPNLNYTYDTSSATNNYGILTCTNGICNRTKNGNTTIVAGSESTPIKARLITGEEVKAFTIANGAASNSRAANWTVASSEQGKYFFCNHDYVMGTFTTGEGDTNLKWLIENTRVRTDQYKNSDSTSAISNGYPREVNGYWSLTPQGDSSYRAWRVYSDGSYSTGNTSSSYDSGKGYYGARPIITMPKSVFSL